MNHPRCWPTTDPLYIAYHDEEWGRPVRDDRLLLERLCLEGFQSGLSWITILRKRPRFREVFRGFEPAAVAAFGEDDVQRLLGDAGIIRHRGKIEATIANARATVALQDGGETLTELLWSFAPLADPPPPAARALATRRPRPPSPRRSRASSSAAAFASSARRPPTRSCRRRGSSTTTSRAASYARRSRPSEPPRQRRRPGWRKRVRAGPAWRGGWQRARAPAARG